LRLDSVDPQLKARRHRPIQPQNDEKRS